ncbi:hypothetical protein BC830DRAFT_1174574 [Chytriomyces sp. MP71]|nr:hypothetical protein BC830DRAFT_1174574 [Chytriomyces sp. MP71]
MPSTDPQCLSKYQRIVAIAVDDLTTSETVIEWAAHHCLQPSDVALLINAFEGLEPLSNAEQSKRLTHAAQRHSVATLQHLEQRLRETGTRAEIRTVSVMGEARHAVLEVVKQFGANVLIVGSNDLGNATRMVVGSVRRYCKQHCFCPVIEVKTPAADRVFPICRLISSQPGQKGVGKPIS